MNIHIEQFINSIHTNREEFIICMEFFINNHHIIFTDKSFHENEYNKNESMPFRIEEITPIEIIPICIRDAWIHLYQTNTITKSNIKKHTLYQLYFNIEEFLHYIKDEYLKTKGSLSVFKYDRLYNHLNLITKDYLSLLYEKVSHCEDIDMTIRDILIDKI